MSRVRKVLLRPGVYQAPQGELVAPASRLRSWAAKFARMKAAGIRVPVAWGHQPQAVPCDDKQRASQQYYLSRFNAGYLDDMTFGANGELSAALDVPGCECDEAGNLWAWTRLPDGREVKTAVGEVSAAIRDWRDGQGRVWPDSIIHVALTPLPVVAGQTGFHALGTLAGRAAPRKPLPPDVSRADSRRSLSAWTLSLGHLLSSLPPEAPMADDKDDFADPATPEGGGTDHFADGLAVLVDHGISLPDDTTPDNFWERLAVVGHALKAVDGNADAAPIDPTLDDLPEEEEATYSGEDDGATPVEEERPVMMSLTTAKTATERKLIAREQERHRRAQLARIEKLVKRGMPPFEAEKFKGELSSYQLSLTEDGAVVPQQIDLSLSIWDKALPRKEFSKAYLAQRASREEAGRPGFEADEPAEEVRRRAEAVSARK